MLAIVRAIECFHIYLYGVSFTIITDCNALVHAVNKANLNPRVARWILTLQNYRFKVSHRAGVKMAHVDALSRLVAFVNRLPLERELEYRQLQDDRISQIAGELEFEDNVKFRLIDGLVYRKGEDRDRFVIPDQMIHSIIRIYHDEMAHCGVQKTFEGIYASYWFPSIRKRIRDYKDNCVTCLMADSSAHSREGELQVTSTALKPFEIVHLDHYGPLPQTVDNKKYVLVVIEAMSRYTWFFATRSTTSKESCEILKFLFNVFGAPKELVSDRGTAFTSREFSEFLDLYRIKHRKVAVASPWANGLAERANRFLKSALTKMTDDPEGWITHLDKIQYVVNNTFNSAIKTTPSKLLFGYDQRNHSDADLALFVNEIAELDEDIMHVRKNLRDSAIEASDKLKKYNKIYYDKRHKKPTRYKVGDYVLVRDAQLKPGESKKIRPKYRGPYLIAKTLGNNRYVVTDIPGYNITAKPYNSILSPDKLKHWVKAIEPCA